MGRGRAEKFLHIATTSIFIGHAHFYLLQVRTDTRGRRKGDNFSRLCRQGFVYKLGGEIRSSFLCYFPVLLVRKCKLRMLDII